MMDVIFEILLPFVADTLQIIFSVIMCTIFVKFWKLNGNFACYFYGNVVTKYSNRNVFFLKFFRLLKIISFIVHIIDFYIDQIQIVRISTDASARFSIGRAVRTVKTWKLYNPVNNVQLQIPGHRKLLKKV